MSTNLFEERRNPSLESAPPKWMLRNVSAIRKNTEHSRENTERILNLLESGRAAEADRRTRTAQ